jgi:Cu+-exporting ATPase
MAFADAVKGTARHAIEALSGMGVRTVLLTGDNWGSVRRVAKELGIDEVHAELLPEDKANTVAALRKSGAVVGMVGDGINDAPALAAADVGIAMATGTDVAMHAAGVTLMCGDPALVADAIDISRRTYRKIKQNLFWAFVYNVVGVPLAAFGMLSPVIAGVPSRRACTALRRRQPCGPAPPELVDLLYLFLTFPYGQGQEWGRASRV